MTAEEYREFFLDKDRKEMQRPAKNVLFYMVKNLKFLLKEGIYNSNFDVLPISGMVSK